MTAPVLSIDGLTIELPRGSDRRYAVENVSFELRANEILCVVGESGSGKTLTAQATMGLLAEGLKASAGAVRFGGLDLLRLSEAELRAIRGARIGMVFQEPMAALNPVMRVGDQIAEALRFHRFDGEVNRRVIDALASVGLPDPTTLRHVYPFQLSGGQRQRVMIAMAMALNPEILIADEPTTALDVTTQAQILDLIRSIQRTRGMAVVLVTHDFGVVAEMADRVAVMNEGRLVEVGAKDDILTRPKEDYTRRLLSAVPRLAPRRLPGEGGGDSAIVARGVKKTFRTKAGWLRPPRVTVAVRDASLSVRSGETMGIVGESGSGKSTLARCLIGLLRADAGTVSIGAEGDFLSLPPAAMRRRRRRIQMIFQDPQASLNPRQRVRDIIGRGPIAHGDDVAATRRRVRELLELVRLDPASAERFPHEFSGGQRQRIGIARALALDPDVLIADEPVSALDVSVQAQVLELLDDLQRRLKFAMIFITHDLRVAAQICDTVAVMRAGEIVERGPAASVLSAPAHDYTRGLLAAVPGRAWRAAISGPTPAFEGKGGS